MTYLAILFINLVLSAILVLIWSNVYDYDERVIIIRIKHLLLLFIASLSAIVGAAVLTALILVSLMVICMENFRFFSKTGRIAKFLNKKLL